ncbi:iron complex transport system ATP-binding protein/vitamin B12 transport system ATP-binding protein [Lishizhenia tianjinensis]|uniref:Iron complex transport system ATP-binding protein/vitamin B12 transport system ATP-binding protein n=1 Tax=Lishizhenia tianjinensis TaxID=477690 RepID=A0A1I6Y343_9FLAO|nr:ABC transporter ATP-binding protein [Lishizhenia tianjinensis]SFT44866.1 iron complex transport system ATP-binding protein/vitamin B12 transport system ATP-binding protein [Lishizhenia tianjinensis]
MILAFKDIILNYNKREVLHDLAGELGQGQIHGLIGPNGAGKSSLLNALAGLNDAQGKVFYDLENIAHLDYEYLATKRAYCEQKARIDINFRVDELIAFGVEAGAYAPKQEVKTVVNYIAEYCGVKRFLCKRILNLSGGEQQLVHFARAVAQIHPQFNPNNSLLFLDEPNSALDIKNTLFLYERMKDLRAQGLTIVCVLHNLSDCLQLSDSLLLMDKGRIILQGETKEVLENKILDHVFGVEFNREYGEQGLKHLTPTLQLEKQYEYVR